MIGNTSNNNNSSCGSRSSSYSSVGEPDSRLGGKKRLVHRNSNNNKDDEDVEDNDEEGAPCGKADGNRTLYELDSKGHKNQEDDAQANRKKKNTFRHIHHHHIGSSPPTPPPAQDPDTAASAATATATEESTIAFQHSFAADPEPPVYHHHHHHHHVAGETGLHRRTSTMTRTKQLDRYARLQTLKDLFEDGFISFEEYNERRSQLIDDITGTRSTIDTTTTSTSSRSTRLFGVPRSRRTRRSMSRGSLHPVVVPRPPPDDFSMFAPEKAIKHVFDYDKRIWGSQEITVRIDERPFARGGLRLVYHLQEVACEKEDDEEGHGNGQKQSPSSTSTNRPNEFVDRKPKNSPSFVAKLAIDPNEDPRTYFRDVEMQAHCAYYASLFNSYDPPRQVEFCKAWILELVDRDSSPLCGVERYIEKGETRGYKKHNNNFGFVSEDERNTPQAFSHFSYEASAHTMIIVDIQGVGDMYTDPQVHTITGTGFGKGNLGLKGIQKFLQTHRCSRICHYLKLPPVNPKYSGDGTVPRFPRMNHTKITREQFEESHYFEKNPSLRRFLDDRNEKEQSVNTSYWDLSDDIEGCYAHCPCTIL